MNQPRFICYLKQILPSDSNLCVCIVCMYSAIRPPNHHANTNCTIDIVKCQYKSEHLFAFFIEYDGGRATAPPPYMSMC